jgi:tetratricopeptide (TPR) repeat protein
MKKAASILIGMLYMCSIQAQTGDIQNFIDQGMKLYDLGDYRAAVEQYKEALKLDKKSADANLRISQAYYALKEYDKAIDFSEKVISNKGENIDKAYIIKGSVLDIQGKAKDAIKAYKAGVKENPKSYLLHYNLGLTYFNEKEYADAEQTVIEAIKIRPSHASSHLLLGYIMRNQNKRVKSILALYNYLLLEPNMKRTKDAIALLESQLMKGVKKDNEKTITISYDPNADEDFASAELMLSMMRASRSMDENKNKTEPELFAEETKSFFTVIGQTDKENKKTGFWWQFYVDFYDAMAKENHTEAFSYYITQSQDDEKIVTWIKNNKDKIEAFAKWYEGYQRKVD